VARLGVRSMICINSEGILWATAEIHYAASSRLPMLMVVPSRALEPPTTVYSDHDDFLSQRDMGWLMFYCSNPQDVFDTILQAYRVIEDNRVMLPAIVGYDGWEVSHGSSPVVVPDQNAIDSFLPPPDFIKPEKDYLNVDWRKHFSDRRMLVGYGTLSDFMELRHLQKSAEQGAARIIEDVGEEYRKITGSPNVGLIETHRCADAEIVFLTMGIVYPTAKYLVNLLREKGLKIGCVKLRVFRPFPAGALRESIGHARLVITLDRNCLAALYGELRSALYSSLTAEGGDAPPMVMGRIIGLGGGTIKLEHLGRFVDEGLEALEKGRVSKELDWHPIEGIDFDPARHHIAE
jgi:pyruvate ferredoxin oxidoreductase alpha subunit